MKPYSRKISTKKTYVIAECSKCKEERHEIVKENETIDMVKERIKKCQCGNTELEIYVIEK